jgi:hypothetical protein
MDQRPCPYCGSHVLVITPGPFGPHHARLDCTWCDRMVAWLPAPTVRDSRMPDEVAALVISRDGPMPLVGTASQVAYAESIRRSMLAVARKAGSTEFAEMLLSVRDASWFIANKDRRPGEHSWPQAHQMAPADVPEIGKSRR